MASSISAFFGGVATVVVALGAGFGGGLYLTDTSVMNEAIGGKPKADQAEAAKPPEPAPAPVAHQASGQAATRVPADHQALSSVASTPPAALKTPLLGADVTSSTPAPAAAAPEDAQPARRRAETTGAAPAGRASSPPFAADPDSARAAASAEDKDHARAQRLKADAARKAAEQKRRAEQRRLAAERRAVENDVKAAVAARERTHQRYERAEDEEDTPRGFIGFASDRDLQRGPTFFGIPLFGE